MITGRCSHNARCPGRFVQMNHLVVGTPALERKDGLQILTLQEGMVAQPSR